MLPQSNPQSSPGSPHRNSTCRGDVTTKRSSVPLGLIFVLFTATRLSGTDILGKAEARIQKYRTGQVVLHALGPKDKPVHLGSRLKIEQSAHKVPVWIEYLRAG